MDTPDLNDLASRSVWSVQRWVSAWDLVRSEIPEHQQEAVWTSIRNLTFTLGTSPMSAAQAIVELLNG